MRENAGCLEEPEEVHNVSRFPCKRCGGTGWVDVIKNGYTMKMRCPDCKLEREKAEILKRSGINIEDYNRFTLENFKEDTAEAKSMKAKAVQYLKSDMKKGIGFFGSSGTGKTHLCIAILQAMGKPHRYWKYRREIQDIKNAAYKNAEKYSQMMEIAETADNLYIDDLFQGAWSNGSLSQQDNQIMFDIIDTRYVNHKPTFFSSNNTLEEIGKANDALASRIYDMCSPFVVTVKGKNRRFS